MAEKFFASQKTAQIFKSVIKANEAFDKDVEINKMLEDVRENIITSITKIFDSKTHIVALIGSVH